jgi:DNA-binding MarR family transcriptional regulator
MLDWQALLGDVEAPLSIKPTGPADIVVHVAGQNGVEFRVYEVKSLTRETAERGVMPAAHAAAAPLIVVYDRSSPDARSLLRAAGVSYAGNDGRLLLQAPPLWIERDRPRMPAATTWDSQRGPTRNPFAVRASRVPRWLLLHPREQYGISELAALVDLSLPAVSRVVQSLEDLALVTRSASDSDAREKIVSLRRPRQLLEAWLPIWQQRRLKRTTWDIGARDAGAALELLRSEIADGTPLDMAVGGLAGAATIARAVEPTSVLVWIDDAEIDHLRKLLVPEPARTDRGSLRVVGAPDPWTLQLAERRSGLPIADPVQLWLDCSSEGERALEAADAIATAMDW